MTLDRQTALSQIPQSLRDELLKEFDKIVDNFRAGRWEPAELNGGKFCEVVYSILKGHVDANYPAKASKPADFPAACRALEKATTCPRSVRIQMPRMLIPLYEIRNNRNVGHVGGDVDPNHMDALAVLMMCRWILAELVRVFHNLSVTDAEAVVEALTSKDLPAIWEVGDTRRVLVADLSAKDEAMLLMYSSAKPTAVGDLINWLEYKNTSRFKSDILGSLHKARLVEYDAKAGTVQLSPTGIAYVEKNLPLHVA